MQLKRTNIPFEKANSFGKLFLDYVNNLSSLADIYSYQPSAQGIKSFVEQNTYSSLNRELLTKELLHQNVGIELSKESIQNIEKLKSATTYTITTGHQLCLATGPLYFIYKILSCINLCEELNAKYPENCFVPVYWLASEDHDFEEINHINLFNKKIIWNTEQKGKVGSFTLKGIEIFLAEVTQILGESEQAKHLCKVLQQACSKNNLTEATRFLVNELFGKYGLVIVDGDSKVFKQQFVHEIKQDVFENTFYKNVLASNEKLKQQGYEIQVTPREINVFYADKNLRERIVKDDVSSSGVENYKVLNTNLSFSKQEFEKLIDTETEKFSPNVLLRPMYQQKILPNAVYVGGPGELAYWLQYKKMFNEAQIAFPVLMPRNFIFYVEKSLQQKIDKLNLSVESFFTEKDKLIKNYVLGQQPFSLEQQKSELKNLFSNIKKELSILDKTLEASAETEFQKNLKSLENLEQKGIRAIKQKNEQVINQIGNIYTKLFPNDVPQERYENFLRFALTNPTFIDDVKNNTSSFINEKSAVVLSEE